MNSFRLIGDMCHLLSFFVLYHKIHRTRSCKGATASPVLQPPWLPPAFTQTMAFNVL